MLLRRQVNEERDEHIDMTPMVDVVFQLMTFMLFSTQMAGGDKVNVPPARHGVGVEETAATFVSLMAPEKPGGEPRVYVGIGEQFGPGGVKLPPATMDQVKKAVADGVRDGKAKVVLEADGGVPHGLVLKVAAAVSEVEGCSLHIGVSEAGKQ